MTVNLFSHIKDSFTSKSSDERASLPNYKNIDWSDEHFSEFNSLSTQYYSYIGWRRDNIKLDTINIEGNYHQRRSINIHPESSPKAYFFGGSTMWGTGADDKGTIPSYFAQHSSYYVENFGESAYTAHQNLVLLIQLLQDGHRPDLVVFYDGVNEVAHKCRPENTPTSHARENTIATLLKYKREDYSFSLIFGPFIKKINSLIEDTEANDCASNPQKSKQVAENLLKDWAIAQQLVANYGGRFLGVLQPSAFTSKTKLNHIELSKNREIQFKSVYPLIEKSMQNIKYTLNLTDALNRNEYYYIDFCHLSPNGNEIIAKSIFNYVNSDLTH